MSRQPPSGGDTPPPIYNGRYELRNQVARGGTAQVYLARDLLLDRPVALKVLFPELSADSSFVDRFRREAQAAANLSHPNIVPVFDWGESERTYFIVMEYVDGQALSTIIRGQAPLPPMRAAAIAADIAKALSYAHRHGVVHRDVKPGNVLLTRDGQVKVTDFGIARAIGADDNVTQTGLVMGTATYFSPEQAQGFGVDGRSDVYSLGVVLYEMVTGGPPFTADTPVAIAYKHVSESPVLPRELEPRIPEQLEAVILHALAKQPADRYATAEDFHADLERFAQGEPVLAMAALAGVPASAAMGATQAMVAAPTRVLAAPAAAGAGAVLAGGALGAPGPNGNDAAVVEERSETVGPVGGAPDMPKHRWIGWTLAGLLLAVALVLLLDYGGRQLGYFGAPAYTTVPFVVGENVQQAEIKLARAQLNFKETARYSKLGKGVVISSNPSGGTEITKATKVTLYYSAGLAPVRVPSVEQMTLKKAEKALTAAGLNFKVLRVTPTLGEPLGIVQQSVPGPNSLVGPATTVDLYVDEGKANVAVPGNLVGQPLQTVKNDILNDGLKVGTVTPVVSATIPNGDVTATEPGERSVTTAGSPVNISVSAGPGIRVPNVVGLSAGVAESRLTAAGLIPQEVLQQGPLATENDVVGQSPTPSGGPVLPHTFVQIVVDQGPPTTTSTRPTTTTTTTTSNPTTTTTSIPKKKKKSPGPPNRPPGRRPPPGAG
jgi:beta-lactam-binding protein with PASTA domain/predicted Ser/Thr protein kinase